MKVFENYDELFSKLDIRFSDAPDMMFEVRILQGRKVMFSDNYHSVASAILCVASYFELRENYPVDYFENLSIRIIPKPQNAG